MERMRVGKFELLPSERVLSLDGKALDLGARAFDLLLVLVEHRGRLASKATLIERVWPRVIVDENNLPAQIVALRRVLGAGAIRTVAGFGYRLELPVSRQDDSVSPAPANGPGVDSTQHLPARVWPNRLGPLIGRDFELQSLEGALRHSFLVTITGPAGIGKTRLAQEIHARCGNDAAAPTAWVSLQVLSAPQHVASAIALALGLSLPEGIEPFTALGQALQRKTLLLVLDGAERLREALTVPLTGLLMHTQGVRVLVTSQVPLGVAGEVVHRLQALAVPERCFSSEEGAKCAAVQLFVQRARSADQRFELTSANQSLVEKICRRLDGNPLAIELAAVRVPSLGLSALLERLDDRFRLLRLSSPAADPRHSALLAALDWSYGLLCPEEQYAFDTLGGFTGSFTLETAACCIANERINTAEAVDLIARLVDRSLVTVLSDEPLRYTLLETARHYALSRLDARQKLATAKDRVAASLLQVLDTAFNEYWSADEAVWLHRFAPEIDDVRAAIDWAAARQDAELAVALYGSAWPLFIEMDLYEEGRARFEQTVVLLAQVKSVERVARFWQAVASYESMRRFDRARYAAELAARMHAQCGDARAHYYDLMLLALNWRGDDDAAQIAADRARCLEQSTWPARLLALGALTQGALMISRGLWTEARNVYQRAVELALSASERQALAATVSIVELDIACGRPEAALQLARPLVLSLRHSGRRETCFELLGLTFSALLLCGELAEARDIGAELYAMARIDPGRLFVVLHAMAFLACAEGRGEAAARILDCADGASKARGQMRPRPVEERMRTLVGQRLGAELSRAPAGASAHAVLDEAEACALALGLVAQQVI
jgi:predicted ATPase/DNA-binding winged helix-turn-helix (wHTH) protein